MHFTAEEQAVIREKMFTEGIQLFKQYGPRRLTVDKLTKSCGIGKGTFYHFYESKEAYLSALEEILQQPYRDDVSGGIRRPQANDHT